MDLKNTYLHPTITTKHIAALCLCLLYGMLAQAQKYHFHNLTVEDGLIQSQPTCLAQDKTGHLWVGTLGGLSRYDGRLFTNYTVNDGLLHNTVRALAADNAGNIWIGGAEGLSCFNGKTFKHYRKQVQVTRDMNPTQQVITVGDTTWWRVQGDIFYVVKGAMKYMPTPADGFTSAMMAERGNLWVAKKSAVYHFHGNKWETLQFMTDSGEAPPVIHKIFRGHDGMVWLAGTYGLYRATEGYIVPHAINNEPLTFLPGIISAAEDNMGSIWLGTNKGAVSLMGNNLFYYSKHNGLTDNLINDVLKDAEGNIWMASDGQGIFRFSGTQFTGLDEAVGLPSAQVMALASNGLDSLFIGTYDAGIYVFINGKVQALPFPSAPVPAIWTLCYTPGQRLWIGTRGRGLWSYEGGTFSQYTAAEHDLLSNQVNRLFIDTFSRMWIGFTNGTMILEDNMFKKADTNTGAVFSFLTIGFDSTLIATEGGLRLFHAGEAHPFITGTIVDTAAVQCFIVHGRELWLGSSDKGIIRYDMQTGRAQVINKAHGMRSDFIYNLVTDDDGNVWVGTGFGIHKIQLKENGEPVVTFYGKAQGISGMESNINSVLKMTDGSIWFGTTNGALHYSPHTTEVSAAPAYIMLQSVKIAGENVIDPKWYDSSDNWYNIPFDLRLPYKKNNIAFTFQAITLSGAQQALYRYHMDGLDAPWSDWSTNNSVTYSALPPGKYTFRVQCRSDAAAGTPDLVYNFEIITPFQQTTWFRLSVLIACILAGILLQYSYNRRKQERLSLLAKLRAEEQGKIRTRTAEDFHDEIGNKLTRINVLTNVLKNKVQLSPETTRILSQIEDNTSQLYSGTRDILWSLKPSNDGLYEILHRIRDFGTELFQDTEIHFFFTGSEDKWANYRLDMERSRNLIMIFKEALNNSLKYAQARNVSMDVSWKQKHVLQIILRDDGIGFDTQIAYKGNGLANMQTRAGRLKGKLYIDSKVGKGTIISLTFKIPPNR